MVEQLVYDLETDILAKIAHYLSTGSIASADYQIRKLSQLGALNKELRRIINQYRARILLQTKKEITESAEDILAKIRAHSPKQYKAYASMSPEMTRIVDLWVSSAASKVNLSMATLAQKAGERYVAAVSKASLSVVTGDETLQKATKQAILDTADLGVPAYVDSAGRNWTPEGYVKMVVRNNQRRVSSAAMFQAAAEGDTDLVEISSHVGARPKCAPYQGKIYSISGNHPKYPPLASTSYGEIDGIDGINCGHILYPFFEGVSVKSDKLDITAKENREIYDQSQQQRAYERAIRDAKRKEQIARSGGLTTEADQYKQRIKAAQAQLREFIDKTGRTRQYDREAIYG